MLKINSKPLVIHPQTNLKHCLPQKWFAAAAAGLATVSLTSVLWSMNLLEIQNVVNPSANTSNGHTV